MDFVATTVLCAELFLDFVATMTFPVEVFVASVATIVVLCECCDYEVVC